MADVDYRALWDEPDEARDTTPDIALMWVAMGTLMIEASRAKQASVGQELVVIAPQLWGFSLSVPTRHRNASIQFIRLTDKQADSIGMQPVGLDVSLTVLTDLSPWTPHESLGREEYAGESPSKVLELEARKRIYAALQLIKRSASGRHVDSRH